MHPTKSGAAVAGLVLLGSMAIHLPAAADRSDYEWFDPIIVVRRHLLDSFVDEPDEEAMQERMLHAMVEALDDPYTVYIPPASEDEFNKDVRGTYVGIGAEVVQEEGMLTIVTPLEGSPALEAGVRPGDVVLEINGRSTEHRSITECIDLLLGDPGTPVTIRVRRLDGAEEDITVVRRQIVTPTVKGVRRVGETWSHWLDPQRRIGYVRLTQFNNASVADLRTALERLAAEEVGGLILDLRDNPGGDLSVAIEVADMFLADGLIVEVRGRNRETQSPRARPDLAVGDVPMIVVVNGFSASASEIVAGALQENGRARVLGTRTFGKGSVQEVHDLLSGRGMLKVTTAHYYLASGRNLARTGDSVVWGVDPDPGFVVPMSDEQYRDLILARRQYESIRPDGGQEPPHFEDPGWVRQTLRDPQLASALEALRARLDDGQWHAAGEADPTRLEMEETLRRALQTRRRVIERLGQIDDRIEELQGLAAEAGVEPLLPPGSKAEGGTLTLRDAAGGLIRSFRIEEGDLEAVLRQLRLTPLPGPPG